VDGSAALVQIEDEATVTKLMEVKQIATEEDGTWSFERPTLEEVTKRVKDRHAAVKAKYSNSHRRGGGRGRWRGSFKRGRR